MGGLREYSDSEKKKNKTEKRDQERGREENRKKSLKCNHVGIQWRNHKPTE